MASCADFSTLSRLLDEALDLPSEQLEPWLAALPAEQAHLATQLRSMLQAYRSNGHADFLAAGPQLAPADETVASAGEQIGPYRLMHEIGRGGMGTVWLAERTDGSLKRQVALKLPRLAWGAGLAQRMARERDIGALLEHPNIARLYDAGVDHLGRPYLALEYIGGVKLDEWCTQQALSIEQRLRLFLQVVRAVSYAHGRLIVHRDLKPGNVLVTPDGRAHLLDFGIAKLLQTGSDQTQLTQQQGRVLTPEYASPEQIRGETITVASDVYALGVLLYRLLTGHSPHRAAHQSIAGLEQAILDGESVPASSRVGDKTTAKLLRGEIDAMLAQALKRDPQLRYATADAFAADIERHLAGERVLAQPDSAPYRLRKSLRRYRTAYAAGAAVAVALLAGTAVSLVQAQRANAAAERARVVKEFVVDVFKVNERGNAANGELRQLPAELLLERGARLIATKFVGQPQLQAELYGVVGGIFANMGANELAADYAARHGDLLMTIGAGATEQARAAVLRAQALLALGRLRDARLQAESALALAASDPPLDTQALLLLATVLQEQGSDEAWRVLERAERALQGDTRAAPASHAQALALRAFLLTDESRFDEAWPIYQSAIDAAIAAEGSMSLTAVRIRLRAVFDLIDHSHIDEALVQRDKALAALRGSGMTGEIRAALEEAKISTHLFQFGDIPYPEAQATVERSRGLLTAGGQLIPDAIHAAMDYQLGMLAKFRASEQEADRLITRSAVSLRGSIESANGRAELAANLGHVAMYAGRHLEADEVLGEWRAREMASSTRGPFNALWNSLSNYLYSAANLSMQGRYDEAEALLATAPPAEDVTRPKARAYYQKTLSHTLARIKLDRGDPAAALALLPSVESDDSWGLPAMHPEGMLRGQILCALGRHRAGLDMLDRSMNVFLTTKKSPSDLDEHAPDFAHVRAVTGLCALAAGQRARATQLAALARTAFEQQPKVSPYFKAPSQKLDRQLGINPKPARPAP